MGKRIVFERDGATAIVVPAPHVVDLEALAARTVPQGSAYRIVDETEVPSDRTFRDAWDFALKVNMAKARNIHRNRLRDRRAPLLDALDAEYQRADEAGDTKRKAQVAARKQRLRDAPADPRIDAAQTPEELNAIDPLVE